MNLDKAFIEQVEPAINRVWQQIGHDVMEYCDGDNEQAVEACIDASRLETSGETAAAGAVKACVIIYGYARTLQHLAKHISLI